MQRPHVTRNWWVPVVGVFVALETEALTQEGHHGTFSRFIRWLFRTHTKSGRAAFVTAMTAFIVHILKHPEETS